MKRLAVFDMDSTLIQCEVIDELARMSGRFDRVSSITNRAMRGEIDFSQSLRERVKLIKGISEKDIQDLKKSLPYTRGLNQLNDFLKKNNYITAILSGGFHFFAEQIQKDYGFDYIKSNHLELKDGHLTGNLVGEVIDQSAKANYLLNLAKSHDIELSKTVAIGDGMNDLQMLKTAGLGIAFCPKPELRKQISHVIDTADLSLVIKILEDQQN